ncbi:MAG: hypothetical protein RLY49_242 [Candidatus Parcubacteria bacterium]|jgi:hypothetical protein
MDKIRIVIRILILLSPFFLPWWLVIIFTLAALFYFETYYEIFLIGLFFDVLYHSANTKFGLYGFILIACILFVLVKQIKKRLILY